MSKKLVLQTGLKLLKSKKEKDVKGRGPKPSEPGDDPFYYYKPRLDSQGKAKLDKKGRPAMKKCRKDKQFYVEQLGIPKEDAKVLLKMKKRAMLMDGGREVLGIRIPLGFSTILTLFFPVGGAIADFAISNAMVQRSSSVSHGIGKANYGRMSANIVQDLLIGLIPVAGAIIDMFYRANTRNANLLEKVLIKRVQQLKLEAEKGYRQDQYLDISDNSMDDHSPEESLHEGGNALRDHPTCRRAKSNRREPQSFAPSDQGHRRAPTERSEPRPTQSRRKGSKRHAA